MRPPVQHNRHRCTSNQSGVVRHSIVAGLIIILLFGGFSLYKPATSHAATPIPEITSAIAGYCLDDHHDGTAANATVDTWSCNDSAAQNWTVSGLSIKHGSAYCLGVQNNGQSQGDKIVLNACNGSTGQAWTVDLDGFENPASGLCLDAPAGKTNEQLILDSCNNLSQLGEGWAATTWSDVAASTVPCVTGTEGQQVACYAERQWAAWQSGSPSHATLLTDYTDGNAYEQWCADFVSYVYKEAGYPFTGGERDGWDEYDANNIQNMGFTWHPAAGYDPAPGDIAFFDYPGGHVEIVVTGGAHPTFVYGDSGITDPSTGNGEMTQDSLTSDGSAGQLTYYLSPA